MKRLSQSEKVFCRLYADSGDPRFAAREAGLRHPEQAAQMLFREEIIAETTRLLKSRKELMTLMCEDAMMKIICAPSADAVRLTGGEFALSDSVELRGVSELKLTDKGGELRFFDKVKAFEKLCDVLGSSSDASQSSLAGAILAGAQALNMNVGDDAGAL